VTPNFLLSGPRGPARGHRSPRPEQSCAKVCGNQGANYPVGAFVGLWPQTACEPCAASAVS
jgi:hypothetical protein